MSDKKRKIVYWLLKVFSIVVSCVFPIWAILEKFQFWKETYGNARTIGVGGILVIFVLIIVFRTSVFNFIRDKLKITYAPPLAVWLIMIAISYTLVFLAQFLMDLVIVLWMGLIGCAIGTAMTFVAEHYFGKKKEQENG